MSRIHAFTGPLVLSVLLATNPQFALSKEMIFFDVRPGTEIQSDQLGKFIAENLSVTFETDMRPLSVKLELEMISREEGVIGKYESEAVKVEGGNTYSGSRWVSQRDRHEAPGFGDRRKGVITGIGAWDEHGGVFSARECEGATHAVRITLAPEDGRAFPDHWEDWVMCLNVER